MASSRSRKTRSTRSQRPASKSASRGQAKVRPAAGARPAASPGATAPRRLPGVLRSDWALLAALYVAAVLVYGLLARRQGVPVVFPDEYTYGNLAQSIAAGHGAAYRGQSEHLRSLLYIYAIAPGWVVSSGTGAYALVKWLNALMSCLVVVPVWLLARQLVSARLALVPALLSVGGTWMASTGLVLTENLAYPLATGALAATVMVLRRPGSRWWLVVVGLAALATYARVQLVLLLPVLLAALALDAALGGRAGWRQRARAQIVPLGAVGGMVLVGAIVWFSSGRTTLGSQGGVVDYRPGIGSVLSGTFQHWLGLVAMTGFVPVVVALAVAARRRNWLDERSGPVLCVLVCATLAFVVQAGWYAAGFRPDRGLHPEVERYVQYVVPLAFILLTLLPGRVGWKLAAGATGAVALGLLATNPIRIDIEQRAIFGASHRVGAVVGSVTEHPGLALAVVAVLAGLAAVALLRRLDASPTRAVLAVAGLALLLMAVESQAYWQRQLGLARHERAALPARLDWIQRATDTPVAMVHLNFEFVNVDYDTEFFNERVDSLYRQSGGQKVRGGTCPLTIAADGALTSSPACSPIPASMLFDNRIARPTLVGAQSIEEHPIVGQLVRTDGSPPRLLSLVALPCIEGRDPVKLCRGKLDVSTWLDRPGTITVRFLGGNDLHYGQVGTRVVSFPASKVRDVSADVGRGTGVFTMKLDWQSSEGAPQLVSITLRQGNRTTQLL